MQTTDLHFLGLHGFLRILRYLRVIIIIITIISVLLGPHLYLSCVINTDFKYINPHLQGSWLVDHTRALSVWLFF